MKVLIGILIVLVIFGSAITGALIAYLSDENIEFTVKEKERVCETTSEGSNCKYLVFTDGQVFQNVDTIWYWKFNSSDVYGQLDEGSTYSARVYGFRVPFFSWYRNIVSVTKI